MAEMKRIVLHWSAGGPTASALDLDHYHGLTEASGKCVYGNYKPEHNASTKDGHYAAHTRALNTGSIGLAMCGMVGAVENPFNPGAAPLNWKQVKAFAGFVAEFAHTYKIPVTRRTILFHAEVQPTLGVWQRGKWDVAWLPDMAAPGDPVAVGDRMRYMIAAEMPQERVPFWKRWRK